MSKTLILLTCLTIMSPSISTAESVTFSYDRGGNRIKREIVLDADKPDVIVQKADRQFFSDRLSEKDIRIYPNPTKGQLQIEISGMEDDDNCTMAIYNMSGAKVCSASADGTPVTMDISSCPDGVYILHISLNGTDTAWKIIKE